jgi:hypothetical protein
MSHEVPWLVACELIETVKMKLHEAVKLVMQSVISHGPSGVLILKANQWLNGEGEHQ